MEERSRIGILGVNILYLIVALLLLTVGAYFQARELKSGLIITEYILVLLPAILYIKWRGGSLREVLRLHPIKAKHGWMIVLITILHYPVALFFNLIAMIVLRMMGNLYQPPVPTAHNFQEYMVFMIIIALSAGICEEVFFRGLMLRSYERLGKINAIVLTSLLFGVFHFNLQNLLGPILLGLLFAYLTDRTNSIFAGMIGHITNNGFAVTLGFYLNRAQEKLTGSGIEVAQEQMPNLVQLMISAVFIAFIAVLTGSLAFYMLRKIHKETKIEKMRYEEKEAVQHERQKTSILSFIPILLTLLLFLYIGHIQITQM